MFRKVALFLGAVLAAYVIGWGWVSWRIHAAEVRRQEQEARILAMATKATAQVDALPEYVSASLQEACTPKLEPGAARSLAVYTLPLDESARPDLNGLRADGKLAMWSGAYVGIAEPRGRAPELSHALADSAEFYEWGRFLDENAAFEKETGSLRYIAIARLSELAPPSLRDDGTFDPGRARYRAQVLAFPSGEVLCEGTGVARPVKQVIGHGEARDRFDANSEARRDAERKLRERWVDATVGSVVQDVCQAGGKTLCFSADVLTDAPDW